MLQHNFRVLFVGTYFFISVLSVSALALETNKGKESYDCICPGFKRNVCSYGPSGNLIQYDNLCVARCSATYNGNAVGIGPRSNCNINQAFPGLLRAEDNSTKASEEWFREVSKEAQVWKKVNGLIVELVKLSNGGGPRCVCPTIKRSVCTIGPSGNVILYDNLCSLICYSSQQSRRAIGIGNFCNLTSLLYNHQPMHDEEKELNEWYSFIESEIQFYREVDQAMSGFFS